MADQDRMREFPLLIRVKDQSGGLNTQSFATEIQDNEAQELKNYFCDPGLVKKRGGTDTFSEATGASGACRAISKFRPDDGSGHVLMQAIGDEVYSVSSAGVASLRATGYTADLSGEFTQGLNKVFYSNGTDDVDVFDTALAVSSIASGATSIPKHTTGEYFLNRLFVNDVDNKSWVHYSGLLDDIFNRSTQAQKLGEGSGDSEVVKLKGYRNQELIVFMNNRIEELIITDPSDTSTWSRKVIDERYGLIAKNSVQELGGVIYFLDNELRVRALARTALDAPLGTQAVPISDKIEDQLDAVNNLHIDKCSSGVFEDFYLLGIPRDDNTEVSELFVFDGARRKWYGPWTLKGAVFTVSDLRGKGQDLYFGNTTDGKIIRMFDDTTDDDEVSYETSLITKKYDGGRPESDKIFNEIEVACLGTGAGTVTVSARVDSGGFTEVGTFDIISGDPTLAVDLPFTLGSAGVVRQKFHLENFSRGRHIDFKITHDETDDIQILEWIVTMQDQNYTRQEP